MEKEVVVLRVEDADGLGIYRSGLAGCAGISTWASPVCPAPDEDGLYYEYKSHRFGFRDTQQLKAWFVADDRRALADSGARLVEYRVSRGRVQFGRKQLTFNRKAAKIIAIRDLKEI